MTTTEDVARIAAGLRWDLAGELVHARPPLFRPAGPLQMMRATAPQAVALHHLGLHVARVLTPLGEQVRNYLIEGTRS